MAQLVPTWRDLVFADTQPNAEKTKKPVFLSGSYFFGEA